MHQKRYGVSGDLVTCANISPKSLASHLITDFSCRPLDRHGIKNGRVIVV